MSLSTKNLTVAAILAVALATGVSTSEAGCGGGGGHKGGGYGGFSHRPSYNFNHHAPTYRKKVYVQHAPVVHVQRPRVIVQQPVVIQQPQIIQQAPIQQPLPVQPIIQAQPVVQAQIAPEQSALQMLAAMGAMPQAAAPANIEGHVGSWAANLGNNTTVRLELQADGQFSWTANRAGQVSTFAGTYSIANGQLVLARSNDQQQLRGTWIAQADGLFNFRLEGATDNGLSFSRI